MTNKDFFHQLLELTKSATKSAWFGYTPVVDADQLDFCKGTNFRVSPDLHGKYDAVWLYENSLLNSQNWPLIIDESIRLIAENGLLIIRTQESIFGTIFAVKHQLGRSVAWNAKVLNQWVLQDGSIVFAVQISRLNQQEKRDQSWTIGVLSNGSKPENVRSLIDSIYKQIGSLSVEFIIAGPHIGGLEKYDVRYVCETMQDQLPRISQKKNQILQAAKNTNIAIFHDRYFVNEGFFEGFKRFGYDFEYITVRQLYETGEEYPAYSGFLTRKYQWQIPHHVSKYNSLLDGAFLNGGLIILKKSIAKLIGFNDLLFHNEAEDVELAWQLRLNGIIPRINALSSATTIGLTSNYTSTFRDYPLTKIQPANYLIRIAFWGWRITPLKIKLLISKTSMYEYAKYRFHS